MLVQVFPLLKGWQFIILKTKCVHIVITIGALTLLFRLYLGLIDFTQITIKVMRSVICKVVTELPYNF